MTFLLKDPEASLDYAVDWGLEYLEADALVSSSWSVAPNEAGGVAIAYSRFDEKVATAQVGGGLAGRLYRLTNHVMTASGLEDNRSVMLRVEKR